ncbi:hypothetical protein HY251_05360, partial [bacterium]|nr:hypothetical protein [bacterium]
DVLDAIAPGDARALPLSPATTKVRFLPGAALPEGPLPLAGIYCLARGAKEVSIDALAPAEGLMALVESAFRLDVEDAAMLERQLRFLRHVATSVPLRRLRVPEGLSLLGAVTDAVLQDLGESAASAKRHGSRKARLS